MNSCLPFSPLPDLILQGWARRPLLSPLKTTPLSLLRLALSLTGWGTLDDTLTLPYLKALPEKGQTGVSKAMLPTAAHILPCTWTARMMPRSQAVFLNRNHPLGWRLACC